MFSISDFNLLDPIIHLVVLLVTPKDHLDPNSTLLGPGLYGDLVKGFF